MTGNVVPPYFLEGLVDRLEEAEQQLFGRRTQIIELIAERDAAVRRVQAVRDLCAEATSPRDVFQGSLVVQVDEVLAAIEDES